MVKQLAEAIKLSETKYNSSEFVVLADLNKTHMKQIIAFCGTEYVQVLKILFKKHPRTLIRIMERKNRDFL